MGFRLLIRTILKTPLCVNGREVEIISLANLGMSPATILRDDGFYPGWRPASKEELASFAKTYHPARWYHDIFGIGENVEPTTFGPIAPLFKVSGRAAIPANQNPMWGLPQGSLILFVKKEPEE